MNRCILMVIFDQHRSLFRHHLCFLLVAAAASVTFWNPLRNLVRLALSHDYDSHIFSIVPLSIWLIYRKRHEIFSSVHWCVIPGTSLFLIAVTISLTAGLNARFNIGAEYLWIHVLALVVLINSGFLFCYGLVALRGARVALFFLLLLIPIPDFLVDHTISLLQEGSAFVAFWLFKTLNVPVLREGLIFHVPSLDLEVSKHCSGIRSSLLLVVTTFVAAELVLNSGWRKSLIVLSVIPIVILKNGLRIVTISLLTLYVNRGFLHGWLHQSGGIVFYLLGLLMLLMILKFLKTKETSGDRTTSSSPVAALNGT